MSVLRETPKEELPATPREMLVPLAEELRNISDETENAIRAINNITDAVEVPILENA